ncbi:MAG TPA: P-loop NTPase [Actinomycetota bacterium]|nr:P-loop NTPase [Actinomycetota bacterium]
MIALIDSDPNFQARVSNELGPRTDPIQVLGLPDAEALASGEPGLPDVLILGPSVGAPDALAVAERLRAAAPEVSVVLVTDALTSDLLQAALRAGVRDVLGSSFTAEQLRDAIERAEQVSHGVRDRGGAHHEDHDPSTPCRVVTVFSAKGGVGKSFIAANLAVLLAQRHARVALIDLDLQFGDQAIMMQLFPGRTMSEAAANIERIDAESLGGYLTPHKSGLQLLAAPLEPGLAETIQPAATQRILRLARQSFDVVVIDTPALFTEHVLAALDESDECIFMTSLDVPSIKNTKLALQTLEMLGVGKDRIRLLLNRADAQVGLRVQEVERMLGARVATQIPSSREVPLSINQGTPLAFSDPRSGVTAALRELADSVGRGTPVHAPDAKGGRFRLKRKVS